MILKASLRNWWICVQPLLSNSGTVISMFWWLGSTFTNCFRQASSHRAIVNLCLKVNHTIHLVPSLSRSSLVQPVTFNHTSSPHQIHSKNTSTLLIGCMLKIWRNKTVPTLEITNFCWWLMRLKGRDMHTTVMMTFGFIGAWASMAKECHTVHKCLSCREQRIPTRPYHRLTKIFPTHC